MADKVMANKGVVYASEEEEQDLVDPQVTLREECGSGHHCQGFDQKLKECNDRVSGRTKTAETCMEEVIDFMHCVDHCVSQTLFNKLK
ncbi:unnamed protein product [Medioppia subpectinata]|uniref:Cytochrome b-c1 complex subunit 6 n=1 Tax=Medioppia subpectinata TaxID=1979941 RepID=A0A7R9KHV3_9ACAR|nr:unnamed protein product [Medioppia subpectinata]CAG2103963.1 unnamed protein product [Medioppia subpectinata]